MALRYAILGYLSTAPGSGYDLSQQLQGGLGWFWSASHSQIYPELKRLEEAGLIEGEPTTVGEKLEKRIYSITDTGRAELTDWAGGAPIYRPNRDPERLQLIFSDFGSVDALRRHLEIHRDRHIELRDHLQRVHDSMMAHTHARIERRYEGREPGRQALTLMLRDLAYTGDTRRAQLEVDWANEALSRLEELVRTHESLADRAAEAV